MENVKGSTLQERRQFCNLRKGAQIPGYLGYIPQFKYRIADTYGTTTYKIAQEIPYFRRSKAYLEDDLDVTIDPKFPEEQDKSTPFVPGQTGCVPQLTCRYCPAYGQDDPFCDVAGHQNEYRSQPNAFNEYIPPPMIQPSPEKYYLREKLSAPKDNYSHQTSYLHARRPIIEPPIPGYTGYIPLVRLTDIGIGARFHQTNKNALKKFWIKRGISGNLCNQDDENKQDTRVYKQSGMIPLYTGYVPQKLNTYGHTYGETTRLLPVCAHNERNYGELVKKSVVIPTV